MNSKQNGTSQHPFRSAVVVMAAGLMMMVGSALAQPSAEPGEALGALRAHEMDAKIIAETRGWPLSDTMAYLKAQAAFIELGSTIAERFPAHFSSGTNLMSPFDTPALYFKGKVPRAALALVDAAEIHVAIHENTGRNAAEWDQRVEELAAILRGQGLDDFVVAFDDVGRVEVALGYGIDMLPEDLPQEFQQSDVRIRSVPGSVLVRQGSVHGGSNAWDGTARECTFGWCVEDSGGTRGVLTAGHCNGLDMYENFDSGSEDDTTHQSQHLGSWGDFEWHTTDGNEWPNWFADEFGNKRRMDGLKTWWFRGDNTCVFGMTSFDRLCTTIHRTSISSGGHNKLVVTVAGDTLGGDSGAGWSWSTTAHGVHLGLIDLGDGVDRSVYSRASRVDNALGVDICESP